MVVEVLVLDLSIGMNQQRLDLQHVIEVVVFVLVIVELLL
jgi:hypothetical protein